MNVMLVKSLMLTLLLSVSQICTAETTLKFGVYGSDKASTMVKKFRPLLNVLETKLSNDLGEPVTIRIKVASTYEKAIDNLVDGNIDFARFGPASYVAASERNPRISILATEKNNPKDTMGGVLAVRADSPINSVADIAGKSFAFGDINSTSGRYFAQYQLAIHGVKVGDLSNHAFLGRHDRVATAVLSGQYDAGSFKAATYFKLLKSGKVFKVLATYPLFYKPWLAREGLNPKVAASISAILLALDDSDIKHDGFEKANKTNFDLVSQVINQNHLFFDNKP